MVPWPRESRHLSPLPPGLLSHLPQQSRPFAHPLSPPCRCPRTRSLPRLSAPHRHSQTPIKDLQFRQTSSTTLSIAKTWIPTLTGSIRRPLWTTVSNTATHAPCRPAGSLSLLRHPRHLHAIRRLGSYFAVGPQVSMKTRKYLCQVQNNLHAHVATLACAQPCRLRGTVTHFRGLFPTPTPPKLPGSPTLGTKPTLTTAKARGSSSSAEGLGFSSKCECSRVASNVHP